MILAETDAAPWAGAVIIVAFFICCAVLGYAERRWPTCDCRKNRTETEKTEVRTTRGGAP